MYTSKLHLICFRSALEDMLLMLSDLPFPRERFSDFYEAPRAVPSKDQAEEPSDTIREGSRNLLRNIYARTAQARHEKSGVFEPFQGIFEAFRAVSSGAGRFLEVTHQAGGGPWSR